MQKIINITTKTVLAIIAAFLATGCIFEKMDMPKDLQNVLIQVHVSSDSMQTKQKAVWHNCNCSYAGGWNRPKSGGLKVKMKKQTRVSRTKAINQRQWVLLILFLVSR